MIQPVAKLRFVERYCNPGDGWRVFVDIDASEEGRTGSPRQSAEAKARQRLMQAEAPVAVRELVRLGAFVGDRKNQWRRQFDKRLTIPPGDRDILAVHEGRRVLWVVEVEGDSSGQPEGKIYKALGQLACALSETQLPGFAHRFFLVVHGDRLSHHLKRARAVELLGISGLVISEHHAGDHWVFGRAT